MPFVIPVVPDSPGAETPPLSKDDSCAAGAPRLSADVESGQEFRSVTGEWAPSHSGINLECGSVQSVE
jgi:hypothetical protein